MEALLLAREQVQELGQELGQAWVPEVEAVPPLLLAPALVVP
ncbi:hypothetical protein BH24ACT22_BH24ACT22_12150 [soil metagenome]